MGRQVGTLLSSPGGSAGLDHRSYFQAVWERRLEWVVVAGTEALPVEAQMGCSGTVMLNSDLASWWFRSGKMPWERYSVTPGAQVEGNDSKKQHDAESWYSHILRWCKSRNPICLLTFGPMLSGYIVLHPSNRANAEGTCNIFGSFDWPSM